MNTGESNATILQYYETHGIEFSAISGVEGGSQINNTYGISAYPTYILIAPNHDIVEQDMWPIGSTQTFINYFESNGLEQTPCGLTAAFTSDITEICEEGTVQFMDESSGGEVTSWQWIFEGGNPATSSDQNPSVYYDTPGSWDVTLRVNGPEGDAVVIDNYIHVYELPNVTLDQFEVACIYWEPYELTGGLPEGGVYMGDGVDENGVFHPEVAGIGEHVITYTYAVMEGCENSAEQTLVVDECVGINEMTDGYIQIFPNPADNFVNISSGSTINTLEIYSYTGQLIENIAVNNNNYRLNTSDYPAGIYSIRIRTTEDKVIKKHLIIR